MVRCARSATDTPRLILTEAHEKRSRGAGPRRLDAAYGGSRAPEGPDHFDGGLNTGHFDGPATKGPDLGGRGLKK